MGKGNWVLFACIMALIFPNPWCPLGAESRPVGCLHDLHRFTHVPTATSAVKTGLGHPFIFHPFFYLAPFLPLFPRSPITQSPRIPPYTEQCSSCCLFSAPAAGAEGWHQVSAAPASHTALDRRVRRQRQPRSWQPKTPSSRSVRDAKRQRAGGQLLLEGSTDKGKRGERQGKNKHRCPSEGTD